ncbi:hypothetical protein CDL12_22584 [Handroanthus impetiginosus]|uniref:BHLH domain-containing protein n=1 Tax=Handroanthus impetiginosus TaxID=429701 RepID=A0A2G9GHV0_9LAMI|nr:hypothetical protein CDL12_22584 [Handroanthus impetiginosus]
MVVPRHISLESSNLTKRRQRSSKLGSQENINDDQNSDSNLRKIVHRDIQRQRRKEMGTLYTPLRSLLPHEYVTYRY